MKTRIFVLLLCLVLLLTGCGKKDENKGYQNPEEQGTTADLGDDSKTFGESLDDLGAYDGYFEGESTDIVVECVSGTQGAYKLEGTTLTFTAISEESVYSISDHKLVCGTLSYKYIQISDYFPLTLLIYRFYETAVSPALGALPAAVH